MRILSFVQLRCLVGMPSAFAILFTVLLVTPTLPIALAGAQKFGAAPKEQWTETNSGQGVISLASINAAGTNSGNGESRKTAISADGRFIVFTTSATDLVPGSLDTNGAPDVFVYDRLNNFTNLVSHRNSSNFSANGPSGLLGNSDTLGISADGRYIVYASQASDIVPLDNNGAADVFLFDMANGSNTLVSSKNNVFTAGGNGASTRPVISANGRFVVYTSTATDLSATSDTNGKVDVYARNLDNLVTKLVSVNASGNNSGNDQSSVSTPPSISDDGRFVAFDSQAGDIVSNDTNGAGAFGTDVFVRDLQTNTTALVSVNSAGTGSGNLDSFASDAKISGSGRFAVFESRATDLVSGIADSNAGHDIFRRDLVAGTTSIISVSLGGNGSGNDISQFPAVSNDGRFVAFTSGAGNLVTTDTNNGLGGGIADVFVRDTQTSTTELVSVNSAGTDSGNSSSSGPAKINSEGRYVLFESGATNLTNVSDFDNNPDLFRRDLQTHSTTLVTIDRFGNAGGIAPVNEYSLSGAGQVVAFESRASNLVSNDTNGLTDVFAFGPPSPGLSVSDVTVTEGDSGTTDAVFTVTLTNGPSSGNVTATASTFTDSATQGQDFQFVSSVLTFAPGETSKTVTVPIIGDTVFERNETFTLELRNVTGAAVVDGVGVGTIIDNEQRPTLSVNDITVTEGDSGTKDAIFTVTLSGLSSLQSGFSFGVTNGTALEEEDFQGVGGGGLIAVGLTTTTIRVPIIGDTISEPNETFFLNITNPSNATISDGQGMATIIDDESSSKPPTVQFGAPRPKVSEGGKSIDIEVTRSGNLSAPATVEYATSAQSNASDRGDYTSAFGKLAFAAGESSKAFTVFITDDVFVEGTEFFVVTLSNPTGASLGNPATGVVQIIDNDTSPPNSNPSDNAPFFARQHYVDFLNREPDAAGLAYWSNQITECQQPGATCDAEARRINVSAAFFLSIEFQETGYLVERIYKAAYGDATGSSALDAPPHPIPVPVIRLSEFLSDTQEIGRGVLVGIGNWQAQLETNKQTFAADFVSRPRFTTAYPTSMTAAAFVDALYLNAGVTPSAGERTSVTNEFGSAANTTDIAARARVLRRVAENSTLVQQETNRAFVLMQYFGYLRRNPNDAPDADHTGYDFWLTKLNQFNGNFVNAEMVKAFIVSIEYRRRFAP